MRVFIYILILFNILYSKATFSKLEEAEEKFLAKMESQSPIEKNRLILKKDQLKKVQIPMGHNYKKRIYSYWKSENQSIWILNSIGKYKPITAAFVVEECKIKTANVLIYREQHGYEIKYEAFLSQFVGVDIDNKYDLTKNIDNISGATLSVNSMDRMARAALILDDIVNENQC